MAYFGHFLGFLGPGGPKNPKNGHFWPFLGFLGPPGGPKTPFWAFQTRSGSGVGVLGPPSQTPSGSLIIYPPPVATSFFYMGRSVLSVRSHSKKSGHFTAFLTKIAFYPA